MKPSIETKVIEFITAIANAIYELKSNNHTGNALVSMYLTMYSNKEEYSYLIPSITDAYVRLAATVELANELNDFSSSPNNISIPQLFTFWETESINRRVDKRHSKPKVKGLQITGKIDLRKWQGRELTRYSVSLDNNNFGWIERDYFADFYGDCNDAEYFYDIFSRVQLHYFKCGRKYNINMGTFTRDSIIWKMLIDEFYACTGNRNGIQIQSYYHHLLRQSMNELDCGGWYTKAGWAA